MADSNRSGGRELAIHLRRVALFGGLTSAETARLAEVATEIDVPAGHYLIHEGEEADGLYVVAEGAFAAFRDAVGQPAVLFDRLRPGDLFGDIALFGNRPHSASVRSGEPGKVLKIAQDDLFEFLEAHPNLRQDLELAAAARYSRHLAAAMEVEKSRNLRMRLHHEVDLELADGSFHPARLHNLSVGGFCLEGAPAGWLPGEDVEFGLGFGTSTLTLAGRVVWRRGDTVGLEFTELSTHHDTIIQLAIRLLLESSS